tara:strand:- start:3401 stop:3721 length:321 start_codon:yes stop_codon:yes gene_type:complete
VNSDDIAGFVSECIHDATGVDASVQHPSEVATSARVLIDRAVEVRDSNGTFVESRCEIVLLISEAGAGKRGTIVDTGEANDRWELKAPLYNDGYASGWIATRAPDQ